MVIPDQSGPEVDQHRSDCLGTPLSQSEPHGREELSWLGNNVHIFSVNVELEPRDDEDDISSQTTPTRLALIITGDWAVTAGP